MQKKRRFYRRTERLYAPLEFPESVQSLLTESQDTREAGRKQGKDEQ